MRWVDGHGPPDAVGFVVGEAPGPVELELGRPFVGPSGVLLRGGLEVLGVDWSRLYVTNVVKSMPTDDIGGVRAPDGEEIRSWAPDLFDEIQRFAAVPFLAVGKVAAVALSDQWHPGKRSKGGVHHAWHPAYVLRRRSLYDDWLRQLAPWCRAVVRLSTEHEKGLDI